MPMQLLQPGSQPADCPCCYVRTWLMQAVEQTIQNLIGSGMDPKTDNDPYNGFIYTSFQVISPVLTKE